MPPKTKKLSRLIIGLLILITGYVGLNTLFGSSLGCGYWEKNIPIPEHLKNTLIKFEVPISVFTPESNLSDSRIYCVQSLQNSYKIDHQVSSESVELPDLELVKIAFVKRKPTSLFKILFDEDPGVFLIFQDNSGTRYFINTLYLHQIGWVSQARGEDQRFMAGFYDLAGNRLGDLTLDGYVQP